MEEHENDIEDTKNVLLKYKIITLDFDLAQHKVSIGHVPTSCRLARCRGNKEAAAAGNRWLSLSF